MFHRSERLLLRPGWIEDAAEVTARISDEAIARNLAQVPWPYCEKDAISWLSAPVAPLMPSFLLTLPDEPGNPVIGSCGLHESIEASPCGDAEIGYWIARKWWGRGFATEAVRSVLRIAATLGYQQIAARHAVDNPASGRVLRKAGFVATGRMGSFFSVSRGSDVAAPEYLAMIGQYTGDNDPSEMRKAA